MSRSHLLIAAALSVFSFSTSQLGLHAQEADPLPLDPPTSTSALDELEAELGYSELTRGPVHEAFAEQVNLDPKPGIIVPKQPPAPINEVAPSDKPVGENATWIDGYWAWNEDADDFLWVSGGWRLAPRGYQWVPGYWTKVEKGYQWIGGFWTTAERDDVTYLPQPPESLEEGPTSAAPSAEHFWIPGYWEYQENDYAWRPGYWAQAPANYVWIPRYYRWTPRGCILAGGYWDYPLSSRGYLFSPIEFHRPVYGVSGWQYTPRVALSLSPLHFHLFVRPNYCHYYFGDYYADRYLNSGWYPWHSFYTRRHCYDPLFTFNVVRYRRHGIDFHDRSRKWHHYFEKHEDFRPPHTFEKQKEFVARHHDRDLIKTVALSDRFEDVVQSRKDKFEQLDDDRRARMQDVRDRFSQIRQERSKVEVAENRPRTPDGLVDSDDQQRREFPRFKLPGRDDDSRGASNVGPRLGDRDGRDGRDDDSVRTLRPNSNDTRGGPFEGRQGDLRGDREGQRDLTPTNNQSRGPFEGGDRDRQRDLTPPRNQPSPNLPSDSHERLQERIDRAREQIQNQKPDIQSPRQGPQRAADRPRIDNAPAQRDLRPELKPSPGAVRSGENSPFNQRREAASPLPSRRPSIPDNVSPRSITPQPNTPPQQPSFSPRQSSGDGPSIRQPTPSFRTPTTQPRIAPPQGSGDRPSFRAPSSGGSSQPRSIQRQPSRQPSSQPSFRSNSGRGSGNFSGPSRSGSSRSFSRGNSGSGNSGRGRKKD